MLPVATHSSDTVTCYQWLPTHPASSPLTLHCSHHSLINATVLSSLTLFPNLLLLTLQSIPSFRQWHMMPVPFSTKYYVSLDLSLNVLFAIWKISHGLRFSNRVKANMLEKLGRIDLSLTFNPIMPITAEHLFYLSQVIRIWILEYALQAFWQLAS
jgi:hypothetical protein